MPQAIFFTILSVILISLIKPAKALRKVEFRTVESHSNPRYFSNFNTTLKNNSLFLDLNCIKNMENGFKAHLEFQIRLQGSKVYQKLFAYTLDICNMDTLKDTLFMRWFRSFSKYSNFMENCPIYSGHYYMNGWKLDSDMVPAYLYAGDYRIKGYGFYGKYRSKQEEFVMAMDLDLSLIT